MTDGLKMVLQNRANADRTESTRITLCYAGEEGATAESARGLALPSFEIDQNYAMHIDIVESPVHFCRLSGRGRMMEHGTLQHLTHSE